MRFDRLKQRALQLPGTTANVQWEDDLVFKVAGKMFLVVGFDGAVPTTLSFKVTPGNFRRLPDESDAFRPAPYLARASWLQLVDPAACGEDELFRLIEESYRLVLTRLPKKIQQGLE